MGYFQSKPAPPRIVAGTFEFDTAAYSGAGEKAMRLYGKVGGYDGGDCGCAGRFVGAAELSTATVREYADSINSKAKGVIIDDIVAAFDGLGVKTSGSTAQEKMQSLIAQLPTGDRIKTADDTHKRLCASIAKAINNANGNEIINPNMPADVVCQQVAEVLASLTSGMHSEFLAVYADVRNVIRNLSILRGTLHDAHQAIMDKVAASDDATLKNNVANFDDLHKTLLEEVDRQTQLLTNLLHVHLAPTEKQLAALITSDKDMHKFIEKIDVKIGSKGFGKVIADVLHGMGVTASFAALVDKALKTVGMTIDEYAKVSSLLAIKDRITSGLSKDMDEKTLHEYLEAAELLYKNLYRNKEIAEAVQKYGRGEPEDEYEGAYEGGAVEYEPTKLDKRIADRKKLKNLIFSSFYKQINEHFDKFVGSLDALSMKVGDQIPLSDALNSFRHVLSRINESMVRNRYIYEALVGYYNDTLSRSRKDEMLANFKMVLSYVESLMEMPMYASARQYFADVEVHIKAIVGLVEKYSEEIAAKFGGDDEEGPEITGGADDSLDQMTTLRYRSSKTINDAIRQFDYKYRVAQIKFNLARTDKELDHYSENYDKLVAHSVAEILREEMKKYTALKKHLSTIDKIDIQDHAGAGADYNCAEFVKDDTNQPKKALEFLEMHWDVKKRFWATVEAVDTYMRVFTDGIVKNPQDVRDIKAMLDDIDVINNWYTNKTGEQIASVFEHFPGQLTANGLSNAELFINRDQTDKKLLDVTGTHYYERLASLNGNDTHTGNVAQIGDLRVGNPYILVDPARGLSAYKRAREAILSVGALKNMLSIFVHVGSRFGGEELRKKVFMSPSQMYNNLVDYIAASAFAQGSDLSGLRSGNIKDDGDLIAGDLSDGTVGNPKKDDNSALLRAALASPQYAGEHGEAENNAAEPRTGPYIAAPAGNELTDKGVKLFKKRFGVWMRNAYKGEATGPARYTLGQMCKFWGFNVEDDYFVYIMKSLAAKVLTVTGMYDVFDRPLEFNGLNPIRMIVGGNLAMPKVDAAAVPLYLRLPLLMQFYRNIFGMRKNEDEQHKGLKYASKDNYDWKTKDTEMKIAMVPDVDGTFAGLIRLMFRKNYALKSADYSDEEMKELIAEVNLIYQAMAAKHPQNTIMETIHELVAEINRRYGVVTLEESQKWEAEFGYRYHEYDSDSTFTTRYDQEPDPADIAILPGEVDEEIQRPSGAQRLLAEKFNMGEKKATRYGVSAKHYDLVKNFRCAIDSFFNDAEGRVEFSFDFAIKEVQNKLKIENDDLKRFQLVVSLIRGNELFSKVDGSKYLLFHETVVAGLNTLSGIHSMLSRFQLRARIIDLGELEKVIAKGFHEQPGAPDPIDRAMMIGFVKTHLKNQHLCEDNDELVDELIDQLFGKDEDLRVNGGHHASDAGDFRIKQHANMRDPGAHYYPRSDIAGGRAVAIYAAQAHNTFANNTIAGDNGLTAGSHKFISTAAYNLAVAAGNTGLIGALAGMTTEGLLNPKTPFQKQRHELFFRFLFNREWVMQELLELIFGLSTDFQQLVSVRFDGGHIMLNYGGLRSLVEELFSHVNYFLNVLRPHIRSDVLEKYTNKFAPGSYYWLQEQLMEKMFLGRPEASTDVNGVLNRTGYRNLDETMLRLNKTLDNLTKAWSVDGSGLQVENAGALPVANPSTPATKYDKFDRVFAKMIFYDGTASGSGFAPSSVASELEAAAAGIKSLAIKGCQAMDVLRDPFDALVIQGPPGAKFLDARFAARFTQLYTWKPEFTYNRSALFSFNQLIAKYIQSFYDTISGKMYAGMLNNFANGSFNRAIADYLYTYPDIVPMIHVESTSPNAEYSSPKSALTPLIMGNVKRDIMTNAVKNYLVNGIGDKSQRARSGLLETGQNMLPVLTNIRGANNPWHAPAGAVIAANTGYVPAFYMRIAFFTLLEQLAKRLNELFAGAKAAVTAGNPVPPRVNTDTAVDYIINALFHGAATLGHATTEIKMATHRSATWLVELYATGNARGAGNPLAVNYANLTAADVAAPINANTQIPTSVLWEIFNGAGNPTYDAVTSDSLYKKWLAYQDETNIESKIYNVVSILNVFNSTANEHDFMVTRHGGLQWLTGGNAGIFGVGANPGGGANYTATTSAFGDYAIALQYFIIAYRNNAGPDRILTYCEALQNILDLNPYIANAVGHTDAFVSNVAEVTAYLFAAAHSRLMDARVVGAPTRSEAINDVRVAATSNTKHFTPAELKKSPYMVTYDDLLKTDIGNVEDDKLMPTGGLSKLIIASDNLSFHANLIQNKGLGPDGGRGPNGPVDLDTMKFAGNRMDPDRDHILFTSLALIIRNLMSTRANNGQTLVYLLENVADVALYMKERMRANIPQFKMLFGELLARCEFLKSVMGKTKVDLTRVWYNNKPSHNPWPFTLVDPGDPMPSDAAKDRFVGILDAIIGGCQSIVSSCDQTLREIGDDPKFFELYQGSLKDYRTQNGVDPLTPFSSAFALISNVNESNAGEFLPVHALGEDGFKLAYATRALFRDLKSDVSFDTCPSFGNMIENYNLTTDKASAVDKTRAEAFFKALAKGLRYISELKHQKGLLTPYTYLRGSPNIAWGANKHILHIDGSFVRDDLVVGPTIRETNAPATTIVAQANLAAHVPNHRTYYTADPARPLFLTNRSTLSLYIEQNGEAAMFGRGEYGKQPGRPAFAIAKPLSEVIKLTESTFKDDKLKELIEYIIAEPAREHVSLEVQNIIDLNIVPVNVHALQREVPLVNLYNYSYTFDRLLIELYYGTGDRRNVDKLVRELCIDNAESVRTAKDLLVRMMINPYYRVQNLPNQGRNLIKSMMIGDAAAADLGRPRFLSDQLYNKALLGSIYHEQGVYTERGPTTTPQDPYEITAVVAANILRGVNAGTRFNARLQAAGLAAITTATKRIISEFVRKRPSITLNDLVELIRADKQANNADVRTIIDALNVNAHTLQSWLDSMLAGYVCLVVYHAMSMHYSFGASIKDASTLIYGLLQPLQVVLTGPTNVITNGTLGIAVSGIRDAPVGNSAHEQLQAFMGFTGLLGTPSEKIATHIAKRLLDCEIPAAARITAARGVINNAITADAILGVFPALDAPNAGPSATSLSWLGESKEDLPGYGATEQPDNENVFNRDQIHTVEVKGGLGGSIANVRQARFDTVFIRNLIFIVNLYRSLRVKLQRDLVYNKDIIAKSASITRPSITEFAGNQIWGESRTGRPIYEARHNY